MSMKETASKLRKMADQLDGIQEGLALPVEHVNIQEAVSKLRAVLGLDTHFAIRVDFDFLRLGKPKVRWEVYVGTNNVGIKNANYDGWTLTEAVNKALGELNQKQVDPPAELAVVEEALAEPLPL